MESVVEFLAQSHETDREDEERDGNGEHGEVHAQNLGLSASGWS